MIRRTAELRALARRIASAIPVSATHKVTLLPLVFVAVGLFAGWVLRDSEMWHAPTPFALVLAVLMVGALNRQGVVALDQVLSSSRSTMLLNGLPILAIFFASAEMFDLATPKGPPGYLVYLVFSVVLFRQNRRTIAADRRRLLQTLWWTLGAAFLLKFVLMPSSPFGGWFAALCNIVTIGLCQPPQSGYLAFFTLLLYLLALTSLAQILPDASDRLDAEPPGTGETEAHGRG